MGQSNGQGRSLGMPGGAPGPTGYGSAYGAAPMSGYQPPGGMPGRPPYSADPPGGFFPGDASTSGAGGTGPAGYGFPASTANPGVMQGSGPGTPAPTGDMGMATKYANMGGPVPPTQAGGPMPPTQAGGGLLGHPGAGGMFDVNGLSAGGGVRQDVGQAAARDSIMNDLRAANPGMDPNQLNAAFNAKYGNQWGGGGMTPELQAEMQKRMAANGFTGNLGATAYSGPMGGAGNGGQSGDNNQQSGGDVMHRNPAWRAPAYDWNAQANGLAQPHNSADWANKFIITRR